MDLESFQTQLDELRGRAMAAITTADDPAELDTVEAAYLGRKGELRTLLGSIGQLPGPDRPRWARSPTPCAKNWRLPLLRAARA